MPITAISYDFEEEEALKLPSHYRSFQLYLFNRKYITVKFVKMGHVHNRNLENFYGDDGSNIIQDKIIADKTKTCLKLEIFFSADSVFIFYCRFKKEMFKKIAE